MEMPRHAQSRPATEATRRGPLSVLGSATPLSVDIRGRTYLGRFAQGMRRFSRPN